MVLISPKEATAIALKYGLDLSAATALSRLATSVEEGEEIAAQFAAPPKPRQYTREAVKTMSPEAINAAREAGQLADLLSGGGSE